MWQHIYREVAGPEFEFVSIAIDPGGPEDARPFVEAAGATFPALVDSSGRSSAALGFKLVPNGVFVDADGLIQYRKDGGFSSANDADREAVRRFARGEDPGPSPEPRPQAYVLGSLESRLVETKMELGRVLYAADRREEALAHWREALYLDPDNLTIRKAIWAVRFPERFHPTIDWDWQSEQLPRERAEEIASGVCGPDGCPIPLAPT